MLLIWKNVAYSCGSVVEEEEDHAVEVAEMNDLVMTTHEMA